MTPDSKTGGGDPVSALLWPSAPRSRHETGRRSKALAQSLWGQVLWSSAQASMGCPPTFPGGIVPLLKPGHWPPGGFTDNSGYVGWLSVKHLGIGQAWQSVVWPG